MKYLISIADIKATSLVNANVDDAFVANAIETVQNLFLAPLIGRKLYQKLLDGLIENGGVSSFQLNDDYYNLITEYIHPYMKCKVEAELLIPISYKMRNMGLVQNTDEHVQTTSLKDLRSIEQKFTDNASAYADRLTKFLVCNREKFPEYDLCQSNPNWDTIIYFK